MQNALNTSLNGKPHILICDDDTAFSSELIEALNIRGFGATALLTLSAVRAAIVGPSILLLDLCMPGMDGVEILQMLATHERRHHFQIVLISGSGETMLETAAHLCRALNLDLLGTFSKPVNIRALCELLETTGLY
jgi:DNA-binding response OmpR family regulator